MRSAGTWPLAIGRRGPGVTAGVLDVPISSPMKTIKAETILAELNRIRKDMGEDKADIEWLAIHHAFCFVSYKMTEFQKYLDQEAAKGAFEELDK